MKLPRYLQLALVLTAGLVFWSLFSGEEAPEVPRQKASVSPPRPPTPEQEAPRQTRIDLFAAPHHTAREEAEKLSETGKPEQAPLPTAPLLPLQILGAWWENHQRIILLTDGKETWPVCERCQADGRIWTGSAPVSDWILKAVAKDHLLFEWQPGHIQQRLELGELQSEPTY